MSREWMSGNRLSDEYEKGIMDFCEFASAYALKNALESVFCPYKACFNKIKVKVEECINTFFKGIDPLYKVWYMHGEAEPQDVEPQSVESLLEDNDDWEEENLIDMINNVADEFDSRPQVVGSLRNDSELPLYEGCSKYTRLSATLKLFNLKAKNGWSDKSFTYVVIMF
ncbi:unnamed protein product [Rhodiola kirilowii]